MEYMPFHDFTGQLTEIGLMALTARQGKEKRNKGVNY